MRDPDYARIFQCGKCISGYYGVTKDNTPGFKEWTYYLCLNCGLNTEKGDEIEFIEGTERIPDKYQSEMKFALDENERKHADHIISIIFENRKLFFTEKVEYRNPVLFPKGKYSSSNYIIGDEVEDVLSHQKYVMGDGYLEALQRIEKGDFGYCEVCENTLVPIGYNNKPMGLPLQIICLTCQKVRRQEDVDGANYGKWLSTDDIEFFSSPKSDKQKKRIEIKEKIEIFLDCINKTESSTLDFKDDYPAKLNKTKQLSSNGKSELKKDITAFANASGGIIIVGVLESRDKNPPHDLRGIENPLPRLSSESIMQLIGNDSGITPPLHNLVTVTHFSQSKKNFVLIEIKRGDVKYHKFNGKYPYRHGDTTEYLSISDRDEIN